MLSPDFVYIPDGHNGDLRKIITACVKHGYIISPSLAESVWTRHSGNSSAGWLSVPDDDGLIFTIVLTNLYPTPSPEGQ